MNVFFNSTINFIKRHGSDYLYSSISNSAYDPSTGTVTNTATQHQVKLYKKHLKANQYFFPDLIDSDLAMFYLANDTLGFTPKINDLIEEGANKYSIKKIEEHRALGELILFKITAVRG